MDNISTHNNVTKEADMHDRPLFDMCGGEQRLWVPAKVNDICDILVMKDGRVVLEIKNAWVTTLV